MIDVTLLGCAALLPLPDRALTAAALSCCGRTILFDCGEGTQTAARRQHVSLINADLIALTHYHGDHILGLPGLMQTMFSMGRDAPLYLAGPRGLRDAMEPILKLAGGLSFPVEMKELPAEGVTLRDWIPGWPHRARLTPIPVHHRVPCQGYAFTLGRAGKFLPDQARALGVPLQKWSVLQGGESVQAGEGTVFPHQVMEEDRRGLKVVISGDTAPCEALVRAARDADLLICDATYGENGQADLAQAYGHMTFAQAGETAAAAGVKRLWLAHYSQRMEDPQAYLQNAQALFPDAVCGEDGLKLTLRFDP